MVVWGFQSLVLIPQARRTHQPFSASNAIKIADVSSRPPSQGESLKARAAPTRKSKAAMPRMRRPFESILREKNDFTLLLITSLACSSRAVHPSKEQPAIARELFLG